MANVFRPVDGDGELFFNVGRGNSASRIRDAVAVRRDMTGQRGRDGQRAKQRHELAVGGAQIPDADKDRFRGRLSSAGRTRHAAVAPTAANRGCHERA